jgi:hypothetical protein
LKTTKVKTDLNTWKIRRKFNSNLICLHLIKMLRINRADAGFLGGAHDAAQARLTTRECPAPSICGGGARLRARDMTRW